jgi:hypothetical protein
MFLVNDTDSAAIRAIFEHEGELSAAIELRRLFPRVTDNTKAREYVRTIAGVAPPPPMPEEQRVVNLRPKAGSAVPRVKAGTN